MIYLPFQRFQRSIPKISCWVARQAALEAANESMEARRILDQHDIIAIENQTQVGLGSLLDGYPLVKCQFAIEHGHWNSWFTHKKRWFFP